MKNLFSFIIFIFILFSGINISLACNDPCNPCNSCGNNSYDGGGDTGCSSDGGGDTGGNLYYPSSNGGNGIGTGNGIGNLIGTGYNPEEIAEKQKKADDEARLTRADKEELLKVEKEKEAKKIFNTKKSVAGLILAIDKGNGIEKAVDEFFKKDISVSSNINIGYYNTYIDYSQPLQKKKDVEGFWGSTMFYADPFTQTLGEAGQITAFDLKTKKSFFIPVKGKKPHSVDRAGETDYLYVRTQNSYSFDVLNAKTKKYVKSVELKTPSGVKFKPRAAGAYNNILKLQAIVGKDHPLAALIAVGNSINFHTVEAYLGDKEADGVKVISNGGSSATGHGQWLDAKTFALLDRFRKNIRVYNVTKDSSGKVSVSHIEDVDLGAGAHLIQKIENPSNKEEDSYWYANVEGIKGETTPSIIELKFSSGEGTTPGKIVKTGRKINLGNYTETTVHHSAITPDKKFIYSPIFQDKELSSDGRLFIIQRLPVDKPFKIVKELVVGQGAGHVNISEKYKKAVVTNHFDNFITIIDTEKQEVIENIIISAYDYERDVQGQKFTGTSIMQAHNPFISADGRYFMGAATLDGDLFIYDFKLGKIVERIDTPGYIEQSTSFLEKYNFKQEDYDKLISEIKAS